MSYSDNKSRGSSRSYSSRNRSGRSSSYTGRGSSAGRSRSGYSPRSGNRRRKKPQYDITKILLGILIVLAAVVAIAAVLKFTGLKKDGKNETESSTAETAAPETELEKEVTVDGISITGMSREQAKEAVRKKYPWGMKITYNDQEYQVRDLLEEKIDALLEEIYSGEAKESYTLQTSGLEEAVKAEAKAAASLWDVPAGNGSISSFDKEKGAFIYAGERTGTIIDQEKLVQDILTQISAKNFQASVAASANQVAPEITEAQAKEMYQVIGTYTTTTTSNKDRNKNIELASDALNGLILQPGEEFSFNKATGERSLAKGYKPAGAYLNGELIEEPGGGVCQVSSTLYNAVVFAGLTTTERHAHSYEPSYVTPGEDAMVSYGGPDMRFVNSASTAIAIRASFADRKLKLSIVGIPILEKGVKLSMKSHKTADLDPPAPVYEEDQTLQPGEEKIVKAETKGSRWVTNLVTTKDGVVVSDEFFHNSTYRGKAATIKRNTSGVVITTEAQTQPSDSGQAISDTSQPSGQESQPETEKPAGPGEGGSIEPSSTAASPTQPGGPGVSETPAATAASQPTVPQQKGPQPEGGDPAPNVVPPNPNS